MKTVFAGLAMLCLTAPLGCGRRDDEMTARNVTAPAETVQTKDVEKDEAATDEVEAMDGRNEAGASMMNADDPDAQRSGPFTVMSATSADYGAYLTDATGRALYMFSADNVDDGAPLACSGDCRNAWPPAMLAGRAGVKRAAKMELTGSRAVDRGEVVTYDGHPLYFFAKDSGPGDTLGEGVESFGGVWRLVSPDGRPLGEE